MSDQRRLSCERCAQLERKLEEAERQVAWLQGLRGKDKCRADGFTVVETRLLRRLASYGFVYNAQEESVQRHISKIRAKLRGGGFDVQIKTVQGEGYGLVSGREVLRSLLIDVPKDAKACGGLTTPTKRSLRERAP